MIYLSYLLLGFIAGIVSGAFGIGGGTIIVPALVMVFGLTQHQAQGTSLAILLPPVFILAVWRYYMEGHVNIPLALIAAFGLALGALIGAHYVQAVPDINLKRAFGLFIMVIGLRMVFMK